MCGSGKVIMPNISDNDSHCFLLIIKVFQVINNKNGVVINRTAVGRLKWARFTFDVYVTYTGLHAYDIYYLFKQS